LFGRFRKLSERGKRPTVVAAASARERTGFLWAAACETQRLVTVSITA